jgi:transposase-like protein
MAKKQYSVEFIEQVIKEAQETNNVALVARRYEISPSTIHTWIRKKRKTGSVSSLPKAKETRYKAMEKHRRCQVVVEFFLDNPPGVNRPYSAAGHKTGSVSALQC